MRATTGAATGSRARTTGTVEDVTVCGGGACLALGATCEVDGQCCSASCVGGECSRCAPIFGACDTNQDCCDGRCVLAPGGTAGGCLPTSCVEEGGTCTHNLDCCSTNDGGFALFCSDAGMCATTGSVCADVGEACATTEQCCSGLECETFPELGSLCTPIIAP